MDEPGDDIDGLLEGWSLCTTAIDGMDFIVGIVTGDRKGRFRDGALMTTSMLITPRDRLTEGAIVETLNSRYRLGKPATEVSFDTFLFAASLRSFVIGPDGKPVEHMVCPSGLDHYRPEPGESDSVH